ncbi:hypothetical protein BUALT_Bualt14G0116000 [Buddleja alternifolia]|uniref:Uncharacterized protein n=1 Tax=Buddleja alternifolia TaxID=168488 RepID=A0AAV6WNF6_9LAMI|nr:hypothetical protein BUALT_Bualt14G0116000 [Buddleja alternifolia]
MPEIARYTAFVAKNANRAAFDMSKVLQVELETEPKKVEKRVTEMGDNFGLFSKEFVKVHVSPVVQQLQVRSSGDIVGAFGFLYATQPTDSSKTNVGYPAGIGIRNSFIVIGCINALGIAQAVGARIEGQIVRGNVEGARG